jgi:hypothetical protein
MSAKSIIEMMCKSDEEGRIFPLFHLAQIVEDSHTIRRLIRGAVEIMHTFYGHDHVDTLDIRLLVVRKHGAFEICKVLYQLVFPGTIGKADHFVMQL